MKLLIVESPAKAKTINKYLGSDFQVSSSFGHIRDLPSKNGSVLPEKDFIMKYEISEKSKKYVNEIIKLAKNANEIYLATDPDREGEAISWHIIEVLKEKKIIKGDNVIKRVTFHEITKNAVIKAVSSPRAIDTNLVNAQQARRALDYLVGFTLSPILWRKLPGCRSAGRVQSVALKLICERENEIDVFITQEYWDITFNLENSANKSFKAKLSHIDGTKLEKFSISNESDAKNIVNRFNKQNFTIDTIKKKQQKRKPPAPFITSSLQQEAHKKLGFSAKKTMQIAQKLYEGIDIDGETIGLITYMRTDGVTLSKDAIENIRTLINKKYGNKYLSSSAIFYKSKAKNAQEAHEAIRPTNIELLPNQCKQLDKDQLNLYNLIWKRTVACQMESVIIDMVSVDLISDDKNFIARSTGSTIAFDGFLKLYTEETYDEKAQENKILPPLSEGENINTKKIIPNQHFTEPPPRYSEATLVKQMEELGIGRPSTYATIISVLQDRKYVTIEKKRFFPSNLGRLLTTFLQGFFSKYVEYDFTAKLEADLDKIAEGQVEWKNLMRDFWNGFNLNIDKVRDQKITDIINYIEESLSHYLFGKSNSDEYKNNKKCKSCNDGHLNLKLGKYGAFLACSNYPDCNFKKQISDDSDIEQDSFSSNNTQEIGKNASDIVIYLKKGPYGWYIQEGEAALKEKTSAKSKVKIKRTPLPPTISPDKVDLNTAINLLSLPLKVGNHPETSEEILMGIGRFGPYLKYKNKFTSIPKNLDPFSIDIAQAAKIISDKAKKSKNS